MAVELTTVSQSFVGTGVASNYATGIYAQSADTIQVLVGGVIAGGYAVSGLNSPAGVTVNGVFALGATVLIRRVTPLKQFVDTVNQSTILEDVFDSALDKAMLIAQELDAAADAEELRSMRVPVGETIPPLPAAADRADRYSAFNSAGEPIAQDAPAVTVGVWTSVNSLALLAAIEVLAVGQAAVLVLGDRSGVFEARTFASTAAQVAVDTEQGMYVRSTFDPAITWVRQRNSLDIHASWFGTDPTGAVNSTAALRVASAMLVLQNGGRLIVAPGTYISGLQGALNASGVRAFAGSLSNNGSIDVQGCTRAVEIIGYGAILKAPDGYKYGGFDPVTGAVSANVTANLAYQGMLHFGHFYVRDNPTTVRIAGFELDGNVANIALGGAWSGAGRQIGGSGLYAYTNRQLILEDLYIHHNPLDGVGVGYIGLTPDDGKRAVHCRNVRCEYNGRNNWSWVGGNGGTFIDCTGSFAGRNGVVGTAPQAGFDIEAEDSPLRDGVFIGCEFLDNTGEGVGAASGDSADCTFIRCKMVGAYYFAINIRKPGFSFHDCTFVGPAIPAEAVDPAQSPKFYNCKFLGGLTHSPAGVLYSNVLVAAADSMTGVTFKNCLVDTEGNLAFNVGQPGINAIFHDHTAVQDSAAAVGIAGNYHGTTTLIDPLNGFVLLGSYFGRVFLDGVQQFALPADAVDDATAWALVNAIKARLD